MALLLAALVLSTLATLRWYDRSNGGRGQQEKLTALPVQRLPDTTAGIHIALPFDYNTTPAAMAGKVDYVWGSEWANSTPSVYRSFYIPYDRDEDTRYYSAAHDLAWWTANHPDWIEYQCDRTTVAYEFGDTNSIPLDITNPAVVNYIEQTYIAPALAPGGGYEGIAFDNPDFRNAGPWTGQRCGHYDAAGHWIAQFHGTTDDPAYRSAILTWEQAVYHWIHARFSGATMAVNFSYDPQFPADSLAMLRYLDIDVDEQGFTNGSSGPPWQFTDAAWQQQMLALQYNASLGHGLFSINQEPVPFSQISVAQVQWAIANYLLVKNQSSFLYICGYQQYGYLLLRTEYSAPIGQPIGGMVAMQGVYLRDFTQGLAIVNPSSTSTSVVRLQGAYRTLYGQVVRNQVRLAPDSGLVLLATNSN